MSLPRRPCSAWIHRLSLGCPWAVLSQVGMLFVVTTLLMLMYQLRCYKLIYGWLLMSVGSLLL